MKANYSLLKFSVLILLLSIFNKSKANQTLDSIKLLIQESKFDDAVKITNRLKLNRNTTAVVYYFDGISNKNLYKFHNAIESFQKSYQLDTSISLNIVEVANCYKLTNENNKALIYYEKAAIKFPENKTIQTEIANMHFIIENYGKANKLFFKLYTTDTTNIYIVRNIAKCFDNLDQEDSAVFYFNKVIQLDSIDYQTIYRLCNIYIKKKKYNDALIITEKYIQNDSLNAKINSINAYLYLLKRDYQNSYSKF
jgi:tetratricopeptide (TPR) repeat protein